jgi:Raf kinase inhibitor-like YbhB/YbcL family protein
VRDDDVQLHVAKEKQMRRQVQRVFTVLFVGVAIAAAGGLATAQEPAGGQARGAGGGGGGGRGGGRGPQTPPLLMTTTAFEDGGVIPAKFVGAMGVSPELKWSQVPMGTQSFVLLMHDPEPALNKGLMDVTHWLVWNIPATSTGLQEGFVAGPELPDGTRQVSLRSNGYMGPGAPAGPYHHYTFELYAVDTKVDVPQATPQQAAETRNAVMKAIDGHILSKAIIVGRFHQ